MSKAMHVIFLSGPIGSGKTTLGRGLAEQLSAGFIDGDDFSDSDQPWYCSIHRTSKGIVAAALAMFDVCKVVVIAYPLGYVNWIYFRCKFLETGVDSIFVSLKASYEAIVDESRGRIFTPEEKMRIQAMIAEGYDQRPELMRWIPPFVRYRMAHGSRAFIGNGGVIPRSRAARSDRGWW
jgi:hypothetical protein